MKPIDTILDRLDKPRPCGKDRWRARCPSCGGGSTSALSIGIGTDDAVLLKCWKGCDAEQVAAAIGLELSDLFPPKPPGGHSAGPMKRRRLITAGQALNLLHDEAQLVALAGSNSAHGIAISDADRVRVLQAAGRIAYLYNEVMA
ncbi:MAG: hypothetical protein AB7O64_14140 [Methylibium sp.]